MTNETNKIIVEGLSRLFNDLELSIVAGVCEDMSPNDIGYEEELDVQWEEAAKYIDKKLSYYI